MRTHYSVEQAQVELPRILRETEEQTVVINHRGKAVGYLLSPERFEAMLETMDIMSNPAAMEAIRDHKSGKTKFLPLDTLNDSLQNR
jgi:PHD/YefM family antitoxin component YafN of YafNO toxin-antitoxin module